MGRGVLLCDDLIFTSRVTGTAKALGLDVRAAKDVGRLLGLDRDGVTCVIVDLQTPGLDVASLKETFGAARVVGYGSHVDAATLHAARVAGCDPVLPRSRFVEELPERLGEWLGVV